MKAGVFYAARDLRVEEVPTPEPGASDIIVRVAACGVCGSDLHTYTKGLFAAPGQIMGHEFAGTVVKVGAAVRDIPVGARVCVNPLIACGECDNCTRGNLHLCDKVFGQSLAFGIPGGFAEYVKVPRARLGNRVYLLPPQVSDEEGALVEPLSVATHAVRIAAPDLNDTVVVFGAGTIGLCTLAVLKSLAAVRVVVADVSPLRLQVARQLGADLVLNPAVADVVQRVAEVTGAGPGGQGARADIVFDCAGVPAAFASALNTVRHGGKLVCIALYEEAVPLDPTVIVQKELKVLGSFAYVHEFQAAIDLMASGRVNLKPLVTHRFGLEELTRAFETQLQARESVKVLIQNDR